MDPNLNSSPDLSNAPAAQLPSNQGGVQLAPPALTPSAPSPSVADSWLPPTVPVKPQTPAAGSDGNAVQTNVSAPAIADDGDIIEKEWVLKAKQIVERTRQDPYRQTKEMHAFKAEYMKKRYNKIIEPVDE